MIFFTPMLPVFLPLAYKLNTFLIFYFLTIQNMSETCIDYNFIIIYMYLILKKYKNSIII